jgi:ABC-2 type transport system permease protein
MSSILAERPATRVAGTITSALTESAIMSARSLRLLRRNHDGLIVPLMLPVVMMIGFVYLFGGAINTGTRYVTYVVPGILLLCVGFGSALTSVSVIKDMNGGIIDRFRSMDISGAPVLAGHVVASIARNVASTALVFGAAFLIGFRPPATVAGWLGALGVLLAYALAIAWISAAVGLVIRSPEAGNGFTFLVMFLPYPSSAFVQISTLPTWIRGFAEHQPATPIIASVRGLLLRLPVGDNPWIALAWCGGAMVAGIVLTAVLFRRRTS